MGNLLAVLGLSGVLSVVGVLSGREVDLNQPEYSADIDADRGWLYRERERHSPALGVYPAYPDRYVPRVFRPGGRADVGPQYVGGDSGGFP